MAWFAVKLPHTSLVVFFWVQALLFSLMGKAG